LFHRHFSQQLLGLPAMETMETTKTMDMMETTEKMDMMETTEMTVMTETTEMTRVMAMGMIMVMTVTITMRRLSRLSSRLRVLQESPQERLLVDLPLLSLQVCPRRVDQLEAQLAFRRR
jgi:hypothetical protein